MHGWAVLKIFGGLDAYLGLEFGVRRYFWVLERSRIWRLADNSHERRILDG
jgi:hypothetical protein